VAPPVAGLDQLLQTKDVHAELANIYSICTSFLEVMSFVHEWAFFMFQSLMANADPCSHFFSQLRGPKKNGSEKQLFMYMYGFTVGCLQLKNPSKHSFAWKVTNAMSFWNVPLNEIKVTENEL
jgi:hypothetical protein